MKKELQSRLAVAGVGNCASSLIEGIAHYRRQLDNTRGLLFPILGGHAVSDIEVVAAFDVSQNKVGRPLGEAICSAEQLRPDRSPKSASTTTPWCSGDPRSTAIRRTSRCWCPNRALRQST
jgi:myo-inositol-1-phosphate synthase